MYSVLRLSKSNHTITKLISYFAIFKFSMDIAERKTFFILDIILKDFSICPIVKGKVQYQYMGNN